MVAASFSTPSGLHSPTSRFLQMPPGLLVTEKSSRVTGFQAHGFQHRSLSLSSTRNVALSSWQSGVPDWPLNGSTSDKITARWWKFCGLALQEPLPSCPWFAICPCWRLVTPSRSLPPPARGKSNPIADSLSRFQFQRFRHLAPHADSIPTQILQQLLSDFAVR